ncbi:hypothetical protein SLS60_005680 [Paraconiothyrium brasiliense]|uniref:Uncharacterized protein n=1 Tax=Paraconiothyrium brasiliense TaxID=300254 RepID=A0ABR3RI25_9PLEO
MWTYQLQETGYDLVKGDEYAVLAQKIAEIDGNDRDEETRSKILLNSYRFQGIIGSYLDTEKSISCTKKWIELLVDRIMKHQSKEDIDTLPIAYNEYGRALMRVPDEKEALLSFEISSDTIAKRTTPGDLPFPYPWFHRALIHAFGEHADLADSLISPILEQREKKLRKDDTKTYEYVAKANRFLRVLTSLRTGMILTCLGHVRRAQGKKEESYEYNQRAERVVPTGTGERSLASLTAYYRLACDEFDRERYKEAR